MPLIERPARLDVPAPAVFKTASARAITKSAEMPLPATVRFRLPSDASEATWSGQPIVVAWRASPVSRDGTLPVSCDASRASLVPPSVPVSASAVVIPRTVASTARA